MTTTATNANDIIAAIDDVLFFAHPYYSISRDQLIESVLAQLDDDGTHISAEAVSYRFVFTKTLGGRERESMVTFWNDGRWTVED